jgi:hypothetical protein
MMAMTPSLNAASLSFPIVTCPSRSELPGADDVSGGVTVSS